MIRIRTLAGYSRASDGGALPVLLIVFIGLACGYMFLLQPWGHDLWFHLHRLHDIDTQIRAGRLRSFLSEDLAMGGGLPVYIYYSQWVYWPAEALVLAGASPLVSLKLVFCVFIIISCQGCYQLLRLHADREVAILGTVLYATSNYFIGDVFARSAYAEFLSYSLAPWLLVAVHRVLRHGARSQQFLLIMVASLMIIFHPLSFMNFGLAVSIYTAFVLGSRKGSWSRLLDIAIDCGLALMLTAFFWLPAVIEKRYVLGVAGMPMGLQETFMTLGRYLNFSSVTSLGLVLSVLSIAMVAGLATASVRPVESRSGAVWILLIGILAYVFLTTTVSQPVWKSFPLISSNIFVWRLLFPLTLLLVIAIAVVLAPMNACWKRPSWIRAVACLAVAQGIGFILWHTWDDVSLQPMTTETIVRELAMENARTSGWGVDEYRPNPRTMPKVPYTCGSTQLVEPTGKTIEQFAVAASAPVDSCYRLQRFWNIRYKAEIDGEDIPLYASRDGYVMLAPGERSGTVKIRFVHPAYARIADLLSIVTALLLLVVAARGRFIARRGAGSITADT